MCNTLLTNKQICSQKKKSLMILNVKNHTQGIILHQLIYTRSDRLPLKDLQRFSNTYRPAAGVWAGCKPGRGWRFLETNRPNTFLTLTGLYAICTHSGMHTHTHTRKKHQDHNKTTMCACIWDTGIKRVSTDSYMYKSSCAVDLCSGKAGKQM